MAWCIGTTAEPKAVLLPTTSSLASAEFQKEISRSQRTRLSRRLQGWGNRWIQARVEGIRGLDGRLPR
jgi:hypothetical protein